MGDAKIEVGKVQEPTSLAAIQVLGTAEEGEVLVICKDLDRKRRAAKVLAPRFEGTNDSKQFAIVYVVIAFRGDERLGEVGARVPVTVGVGLKEDSTSGIARGVSGNGEGGGEVGE